MNIQQRFSDPDWLYHATHSGPATVEALAQAAQARPEELSLEELEPDFGDGLDEDALEDVTVELMLTDDHHEDVDEEELIPTISFPPRAEIVARITS